MALSATFDALVNISVGALHQTYPGSAPTKKNQFILTCAKTLNRVQERVGNGFIGHEVPGVPVTPLEPLTVLIYYIFTYFKIFITVPFFHL